MKNTKFSSLKTKGSSNTSRRKFLAGLGVAAAVVAAAPALKTLKTVRGAKSGRGLASTGKRRQGRPALLAGAQPLKIVEKLTRPIDFIRPPLTS